MFANPYPGQQAGQSVFSLRDSGIGMSEQTQQQLSGQVTPSPGTANEMGIGLGLRICRELVLLN
ncbi:hypothetical protein [Fibrella aquatica]|uniref:hypothetical protein n=1 Tax=Fibrella aquatica TaxID=3242487 RepID=UPI003520245E